MWKKIECRDNYSVSRNGEVRNDKTGRILKPHKGTSGYYQIMLGRKTSPLYVHRLVATAFIENIRNCPQVDHINGCKTDNRVENLRWVTVSENALAFGHEQNIEARKKKVLATKDGTSIIFNSRNEAAEYFNCDKSKIKYDHEFIRGEKAGWVFTLVKDIV